MSKTVSDKQPPVDKIKSLDGSIVIPIWRNEHPDGKISYSVSEAERTYVDRQANQYQTSSTIFDRDLLEVSQMYCRAFERIRHLRDADYQQKKLDEQGHIDSQQAA